MPQTQDFTRHACVYRYTHEAVRFANYLTNFHVVTLLDTGSGGRADIHIHYDLNSIGHKVTHGQRLSRPLAAMGWMYAPAECCFQYDPTFI